jgi:hypothetical protein
MYVPCPQPHLALVMPPRNPISPANYGVKQTRGGMRWEKEGRRCPDAMHHYMVTRSLPLVVSPAYRSMHLEGLATDCNWYSPPPRHCWFVCLKRRRGGGGGYSVEVKRMDHCGAWHTLPNSTHSPIAIPQFECIPIRIVPPGHINALLVVDPTPNIQTVEVPGVECERY